jgi:hypothetical protein
MNSSLEQTTSLSSATDILSYRGAKNMLEGWKKEGTIDKNWKALMDFDNNGDEDIKRTGTYVDTMLLIERGLRPELFNEQMKLMYETEDKSPSATIERMRQMYGLNYTGATQLYQKWDEHNEKGDANTYFKSDAFAKELEKLKAENPNSESIERDILTNVKSIEKYTAQIGQYYTDLKQNDIYKQLLEVLKEGKEKGVIPEDEKPPEQPANFPPEDPKPKPVDTTTLEGQKIVAEEAEKDAVKMGDLASAREQRAAYKGTLKEAESLIYKWNIGGNTQKGKATLFTGDANMFDTTEDESNAENLMKFGKAPAGSAASEAFSYVMSELKGLRPDQILRADKENMLQVPDVISDASIKQLKDAIDSMVIELRKPVVVTAETWGR